MAHSLYQSACNRAVADLTIGRDIDETGELLAAEIIKALQHFLKTSAPKDPVIVHFGAGDGPWIGYGKLAGYLSNWEAAQPILARHCVDLSLKPDMDRIVAFPLEAIFPQKRRAYFAAARMAEALSARLGIPKGNRNLFYGDLIADAGGAVRPMTDLEYDELSGDVAQNGLMLEEFREGKIPEGIQKRHIAGVERHAREMGKKLEMMGGPHLVLWGPGRAAFAGAYTEENIFIAPADYSLNAAHAKENAGMANMYAAGGQRPRHGVVAFSTSLLLSRRRQGKEMIAIGIATGNDKSAPVRALVEGDPASPLAEVRQSAGVIILDEGAAHGLRCRTHPWDFKIIGDWPEPLVARFFTRLSLDCRKPIRALTGRDFLDAVFGPGAIPPQVRKVRAENLRHLTAERPWEISADRVASRLSSSVITPDRISHKLSLPPRSSVLIINPHLDDDFLAVERVVGELSREGHQVATYYLAKGYTAVHDRYALDQLYAVGQLSEEEIRACPPLPAIAGRLSKICAARMDPHADTRDFDPWRRMSMEERTLRAQCLLSQIKEWFSLQGVRPESGREISALVEFVAATTLAKPPWGGVDIEFMSRIKTWIRTTEAICAFLSLGLGYGDIYPPLETSWYTASGRRSTARQSDIDRVKEIIRHHRPHLLISNGEGFPDYGAHSTTELTTSLALLEIQKEGILGDLCYLQYAGVWERIPAYEAELSIVLSRDDLERFHRTFRNFYPSQAPAPVPDPGNEGFFSGQVWENAIRSREELEMFLDDSSQCLDSLGVLHYRRVSLADPSYRSMLESKKEELQRVRTARELSSTRAFQGDPPQPSCAHFRHILEGTAMKDLGQH